MQVLVKLLGTLPAYYPGSYPATGLALTLPDAATVTDLVTILGLPEDRLAMVTINDVLARADQSIPANAIIKFLQPLAGG